MAWYRAGGGGIPSSLKSGMNNVLNKKFGTSTTYPPNTWPDNVNLLGPLPEKTVSGAIASFSDGADDVPLKNCIAMVAANLSGVSSVGVTHAKKSLINFVGNVRTTTSAGLTMEATASGGIRLHGTTTGTYAYMTSRFDCFLKAGATYTFSRDMAKSYRLLLNCTYADNSTGTQAIASNTTSRTFTPEKDIVQIRLETANMQNSTAYDDTILMMVESGGTATDFVKYEAPETKTANLGRTIYGGSVDVVQGTGKDENDNDFTFEPIQIDSYLGNNNIWADAGDISDCTYRADIALALNAVQNNRGVLSMSRSVAPELVGERSEIGEINELEEKDGDLIE